jgi:tetratricopeptide (TPR) repeat protein
MKAKDPRDAETLRARIDDALRRERPRHEVEPLLLQLLTLASDNRELYVYAHRHLAEIWIEEQPWRAALHLRRVMRAGAASDTTHALMGLCQALLGNYNSAVVHYERALSLEPANAWYHHNLGHLLDVALDRPQRALPHLRSAHTSQPMEDEVTASLAHCLARLGALDEAEQLAREALDLDPDQKTHASLLAWIRKGAPGGFLLSAHGRRQATESRGQRRARSSARSLDDDVMRALEREMQATGAPAVLVSRAALVWRDYLSQRPNVRVAKPEVHAAALEYAVSLMHAMHGVTQSGIAKRYGVSSAAVSSRYVDIRSTLNLEVGDPRYL